MENYARNMGASAHAFDESDDDNAPAANMPKRSPMRRKEKFRAKDFKKDIRYKDRKRNYRNNKYDFVFKKVEHVFMREDDILSLME